jgi:hypothetical protein
LSDLGDIFSEKLETLDTGMYLEYIQDYFEKYNSTSIEYFFEWIETAYIEEIINLVKDYGQICDLEFALKDLK